jgi:hypothetical protein
MEEDVSRAIKQLESIALKAMKSGYLDDAAKVMHIAEEIERVDKSGVGAQDVETAEPGGEPGECRGGSQAADSVQPLVPSAASGVCDQSNEPRQSSAESASESESSPERSACGQNGLVESQPTHPALASHADDARRIAELEGPGLNNAGQNVVPLYRFRMRRDAAVGDDGVDSPRQ